MSDSSTRSEDRSTSTQVSSSLIDECIIGTESPPEPKDDLTCVTCGESPCAICTYQEDMDVAMSVAEGAKMLKPELTHKECHHMVYFEFIRQLYGNLGQGYRVPIPVCITAEIRDGFPEPDGCYVCFAESDGVKK